MTIITAARTVTLKDEDDLLSYEEETAINLRREKEVARHNHKAHMERRKLRQAAKKQRVMA